MLLTEIELVGLRHGPPTLRDLDAEVVLPAPPAGVAVADALELLAISIDPGRAPAALARLGLAGPELEVRVDDHGRLEEVTGIRGEGAAALVEDDSRQLVVAVTVTLDPILYGQVRAEAQRDPRVVAALAQRAELSLRLGWLFTPDHTAASVSMLRVAVGDVVFPLTGVDRPPWLDTVLRAVAARVHRVDVLATEVQVAEGLHGASLSSSPLLRQAWERVRSAMASPPFSLGSLGLLRGGDGELGLVFGDGLVRARQLGPAALRAVRVASAALIHRPDVLVVDEPVDADQRAWLVALTEGDDATLEQVILLRRPFPEGSA